MTIKQLLDRISVVSGNGLTHPWDATSYLIEGDVPALIDCGSYLGYPALKHTLAEKSYLPSDIRCVVGTHGHWDHLSGMAPLKEESSAILYLHDADRGQVESGDVDLTASFLYDHPFPPVNVDRSLNDGDVLCLGDIEFTIYHTPGHTRGSICLYTEATSRNLLIAGDTLWGGAHSRIASDLDAWTQSLDRLLDLDFEVATFGHYNNLIQDAKRKVRKARRFFGAYFDPWFELNEV